jgi:hypothetical protein
MPARGWRKIAPNYLGAIFLWHFGPLAVYKAVMKMRFSGFFGCLFLLMSPNYSIADDARTALEQWLETRRVESRERADWAVERELLTDSDRFLREERERLQALLDELEERQDATETERLELSTEREALDATTAIIETALPALEKQLLRLAGGFPSPLHDQVSPLLRRIPTDDRQSRLGVAERLQNIVGILGEADKFNGTLTLTREIREEADSGIPPGEVRTLYIGMSMAYFIDGSGRRAGMGFPGPDGWEWQATDAHAAAIRDLIDDYEGSGNIRLVRLPAKLRNPAE